MRIIFCILVFLLLDGVFGVDVKSVMEGDSVTLQTDLTEIKRDDLITWTFGTENTRIAQINGLINMVYDGPNGIFRDRLKLDHQTGSLTITNITTEHSGLYSVFQFTDGKEPKKFSIIVFARLPVPVISSNSSQCSSSSSYCSLVCSVVNVSDVTLSWYKGNSLLSSTSVSDLSMSLSLPLEVEYQDKNTYSCVINNPISNQTQHLDISKLCQPCSAQGLTTGQLVLVYFFALAVVAVFCVFYCYYYRKSKEAANQGQPDGEEHIELRNGEKQFNCGSILFTETKKHFYKEI
ncbi:CD48 antigen-like [Labeo rohita]|uniref:CD48 antigen-like n=1 Tax=Labeo rohita TaxID=84645 RepID=UPI0021E2ECC8|nr:CD48 antigen-like [Labeo rohita]